MTQSEKNFRTLLSGQCKHYFREVCNRCTYYTIKTALDENIRNQVDCPEQWCSTHFNTRDIRRILMMNKDRSLLNKYVTHLTIQYLDSLDNFYWCAHGCGAGQFSDCVQTRDLKINCSLCEKDTCVYHRIKWHEAMTCDEYDHLYPPIDHMSKQWIDINSKSCPRCHCKIEKNGGCFHMICKKCRHQFCWNCLANYRSDVTRASHQHKISCEHHPIGKFLTRIHLLRRRQS